MVKNDAFEVELSREDINKAATSQYEKNVESSLSKSLDYEKQASQQNNCRHLSLPGSMLAVRKVAKVQELPVNNRDQPTMNP